jgi:hypothetical protein
MVVDLLMQALVQLGPVAHLPLAQIDADHRVAPRPVPARLGRQPLEQRPVAFEQLFEGVHQQALAEAPRAAEEVVGLAELDQVDDQTRLVDVVACPCSRISRRFWMPMGRVRRGGSVSMAASVRSKRLTVS